MVGWRLGYGWGRGFITWIAIECLCFWAVWRPRHKRSISALLRDVGITLLRTSCVVGRCNVHGGLRIKLRRSSNRGHKLGRWAYSFKISSFVVPEGPSTLLGMRYVCRSTRPSRHASWVLIQTPLLFTRLPSCQGVCMQIEEGTQQAIRTTWLAEGRRDPQIWSAMALKFTLSFAFSRIPDGICSAKVQWVDCETK